jgi:hypothetical protein
MQWQGQQCANINDRAFDAVIVLPVELPIDGHSLR